MPIMGGDQITASLSNVEAEYALLGCIMFDNEALYVIPEELTPAAFSEPANAATFEAILELRSAGRGADAVTVAGIIAGRVRFEDTEDQTGAAYRHLAMLIDNAPPVANARDYAAAVLQEALARDLFRITDKAAERLRRREAPPEAVLEDAERDLLGLRIVTGRRKPVKSAEAIARVFDALSSEAQVGIATGLEPLDKQIGDWLPGDLIVGCGRPGAGKSAVAGVIGTNVALDQGRGYLEVNLEMSVEQMWRRRLCEVAHRINPLLAPAYSDVRRKRVSDEQKALLWEAAERLRSAPIVSVRASGMDIAAIVSLARRQAAEWKRQGIEPGLLSVDHLGLVLGPGQGRYEQQTNVAIKVKEAAEELQLPVFALAQLSRKVEERDDKRPILPDLRDCVTGDTRVQLANGELRRIDSLVGEAPDVIAHENGRQVVRRASDIWLVGRREVCEVTLRSGRRLRCTGRHRLLGPRGWARIEDMTAGFRVAVAADVFWDEIVSIESAGIEPVYDITVPGPASWLANGIISHNSGAIEENADIVIGFYRPAYYAEQEPEPRKEIDWADWDERKKSKDIETLLLKVREGRRGVVKLYGDMATNAIRGEAPGFNDMFRG